MPDLTEEEKKRLKLENAIRKLELEFEREMNKEKQPNPFDVKPRSKNKGGGMAQRGLGRAFKKGGRVK